MQPHRTRTSKQSKLRELRRPIERLYLSMTPKARVALLLVVALILVVAFSLDVRHDVVKNHYVKALPSLHPTTVAHGSLIPTTRLELANGTGFVSFPISEQDTVVTFFASWCEACESTLQSMISLSTTNEKVRFVVVDFDDPMGLSLVDRTATERASITVLEDRSGAPLPPYNVMSVPVTFAINANNRVTSVRFGELGRSGLAELIHTLNLDVVPLRRS